MQPGLFAKKAERALYAYLRDIFKWNEADTPDQAIEKAKQFNFDLKGASLASDAFFPFDDCVKIAQEAGIEAFIQPGGSVRDKDSVAYCQANGLAMVMTGLRHFKH